LVLFDSFIIGIKQGEIFDDNIFELLEMVDGKVVSVKYCGAWIVVNNGYHSWSTTVPPFTKSCVRTEIRWSEWVESMRKDVECMFGILKGPLRFFGVAAGVVVVTPVPTGVVVAVAAPMPAGVSVVAPLSCSQIQYCQKKRQLNPTLFYRMQIHIHYHSCL
jgi:hypothetical protein